MYNVESVNMTSSFVVDLSSATPAELSIIIPTLNESKNIPLLVEKLRTILDRIDWEAIIVDDDSTDGTASVAKTIAQQDARIRCIHRIGRRGLSSAVVEGVLSSSA